MNIEKVYLFVIFFGILLFIFNSLLIYLIFREYLVLFLIVLGSIAFFLFFILYLRIQHNIDRKAESLLSKTTESHDEIIRNIKELKLNINSKFEEQEQVHEEIVDFLEKLLDYIKKVRKIN